MRFLDNPLNKLRTYYDGTIVLHQKENYLYLIDSIVADGANRPVFYLRKDNGHTKLASLEDVQNGFVEIPKEAVYLNNRFSSVLLHRTQERDYAKSMSYSNMIFSGFGEVGMLPHPQNFPFPLSAWEYHLFAVLKAARLPNNLTLHRNFTRDDFYAMLVWDYKSKQDYQRGVADLLAGNRASFSPDGHIKYRYQTPAGGLIEALTMQGSLGFYDSKANTMQYSNEGIMKAYSSKVGAHLPVMRNVINDY